MGEEPFKVSTHGEKARAMGPWGHAGGKGGKTEGGMGPGALSHGTA